MTLYSLDGRKQTDVPKRRQDLYRLAMSRLSDQELKAVNAAINRYIDQKEVFVSSFVPGNVWTDTPYQAIHDNAALGNYDLSRWMFGLLVWKAIIDRYDDWYFKMPLEIDANEILGVTYFKRTD